ncbi:MAG: DNA polymerase IV [Candidatus Lokiarchaeota archaeon]|nr:DNA polymerase IV [Candidatus Lokiarchaeota archaeon]
MTQWIAHVDMDAFFASVEQFRINPALVGQPVCVGPDPTKGPSRGVVRTASYEAREYGITSGMPVSKAHSLCPEAIFVSSSFQHYKDASADFMTVLYSYADEDSIRKTSIDEAYIDVSHSCSNSTEGHGIAQSIQDAIKRSTRLPCSIGIGPNMSVAKISTDMNKPMGITLAPREPDELRDFLAPLDVRVINGIGSKTAEKLYNHGLHKLSDIQSLSIPQLVPIMGNSAQWLYNRACGIDNRTIQPRGHRRSSFSKETTFAENISPDDMGMILKTISNLCDSLYSKLSKRGLGYQTVSIRLRYADFTTILRSTTLPTPTDSHASMEKTAINLYEENRAENRPIRLLGVKLSSLQDIESQMKLTQFI